MSKDKETRSFCRSVLADLTEQAKEYSPQFRSLKHMLVLPEADQFVSRAPLPSTARLKMCTS